MVGTATCGYMHPQRFAVGQRDEDGVHAGGGWGRNGQAETMQQSIVDLQREYEVRNSPPLARIPHGFLRLVRTTGCFTQVSERRVRLVCTTELRASGEGCLHLTAIRTTLVPPTKECSLFGALNGAH